MCKSIVSGIGALLLLMIVYGFTFKYVDRDYTFDDQKGRSLVIMSLTGSGTPRPEVYYELFEKKTGGSEDIFVSGSIKLPEDGGICRRRMRNIFPQGLSNCHGRVIVIEVLPGDYIFRLARIVDWNAVGKFDELSFNAVKLDMKFSVAPNQILYIGNIHFYFYIDPEWINFGLVVVPSNEKNRDITVVKNNFPNIPVELVNTSIIEKPVSLR